MGDGLCMLNECPMILRWSDCKVVFRLLWEQQIRLISDDVLLNWLLCLNMMFMCY